MQPNRFLSDDQPLTEHQARMIASWWCPGIGSSLHVFASSGRATPGAVVEAERALTAAAGVDACSLRKLVEYLQLAIAPESSARTVLGRWAPRLPAELTPTRPTSVPLAATWRGLGSRRRSQPG